MLIVIAVFFVRTLSDGEIRKTNEVESFSVAFEQSSRKPKQSLMNKVKALTAIQITVIAGGCAIRAMMLH